MLWETIGFTHTCEFYSLCSGVSRVLRTSGCCVAKMSSFVTVVSGQPVDLIFKGQDVQKEKQQIRYPETSVKWPTDDVQRLRRLKKSVVWAHAKSPPKNRPVLLLLEDARWCLRIELKKWNIENPFSSSIQPATQKKLQPFFFTSSITRLTHNAPKTCFSALPCNYEAESEAFSSSLSTDLQVFSSANNNVSSLHWSS
jgi:hypothetical protein